MQRHISTRINFNSSSDKHQKPNEGLDEVNYPFPNPIPKLYRWCLGMDK